MTHVLLTRPLEASESLARELTAIGLTPVVMPFHDFVARMPGKFPTEHFSEGCGRKLAVFTSPRAVQFGHSHVRGEGASGVEVAVIGSATRRALESKGIAVHLQSATGYTSEDFLKMPGLAENPGQAVIFCAPGGREALADGLKERGWNVDKAMVYERVPLQPAHEQVDVLSAAGQLLSTWTSISAIQAARQHLPAAVFSKILGSPALVISARIQHHLQRMGASHVELADGPGNAGLLQSIKQLTGR